MEKEIWHSLFAPKRFLSKVDLDKLIDRNEIYNENRVEKGVTPCIFCQIREGRGVILNDKSYVCKNCFSKVSRISYPEKYEALRRENLVANEARRLAFTEFSKKYEYRGGDNPFFMFAWLSLGLLFVQPVLLVITPFLFFISMFIEKQQNQKRGVWNKQKAEWENNYPEPSDPVLRHFHDPEALLSTTDYKILKIFNNWPGYPPFWSYLREIVLSRDGDRCQVSGCPSRVTLHVHHKTPVSKGGEHVPQNLVTLCDFHHALEPDEGHERIWGNIKTRYFTLIREHIRSNRSGDGVHQVKPHIRRLELISVKEIEKLRSTYGFMCPECGSDKLEFSLNSKNNRLKIGCETCNKHWEGKQQLTEETGPRLAELLKVSKNIGQWKARWDMLATRTDSAFKSLSSSSGKKKRKTSSTIKTLKNDEKPICPECDSPMKLISPRRGQKWSKFWGCSKYQSTGCKGSKRA